MSAACRTIRYAEEGELYVLAESAPRKDKERAIRQRKLKRYWNRLGELKAQLANRPMSRDELLEKIGAVKDRAGRQAATLVGVEVAAAKPRTVPTLDPAASGNPKTKLRRVRLREGCYLLRTNMTGRDPDEIWRYYMQLVTVEEAFRLGF